MLMTLWYGERASKLALSAKGLPRTQSGEPDVDRQDRIVVQPATYDGQTPSLRHLIMPHTNNPATSSQPPADEK